MELIIGTMVFIGGFVFTWYWVLEEMGMFQ